MTMAENRDEFLARVAATHDGWVERNIEDAPFAPDSRPESGDYNLWHLDVDADAVAEAEFARDVGPFDVLEDDIPADMLDLTEAAPETTGDTEDTDDPIQ
jgi:hypothetical protein